MGKQISQLTDTATEIQQYDYFVMDQQNANGSFTTKKLFPATLKKMCVSGQSVSRTSTKTFLWGTTKFGSGVAAGANLQTTHCWCNGIVSSAKASNTIDTNLSDGNKVNWKQQFISILNGIYYNYGAMMLREKWTNFDELYVEYSHHFSSGGGETFSMFVTMDVRRLVELGAVLDKSFPRTSSAPTDSIAKSRCINLCSNTAGGYWYIDLPGSLTTGEDKLLFRGSSGLRLHAIYGIKYSYNVT